MTLLRGTRPSWWRWWGSPLSASLDWELDRAKGSQLGEQQPSSAIKLSPSPKPVPPTTLSSPDSLTSEEEESERRVLVVEVETSKKEDINAQLAVIVEPVYK